MAKKKEFRSLKISSIWNYGSNPSPQLRLQGRWLEELGFQIGWNTKKLPFFMEWKSTASGDYVIGLEPANSSVYGRPWHEARGSVHRLAPFASETNVLTFTSTNLSI